VKKDRGSFFGRRKGRPLRVYQQSLLDNGLGGLRLELDVQPEQFLKNVQRFSDKNCSKNKERDHCAELSEAKNALPQDLRQLFHVPVDKIQLEIGFGGGEHLMDALSRCSDTGFIGVEPFVNGMAKLLSQIDNEPELASRLRLYDDDAVHLLDWLPPASIDGIDLFYPDPWPKKKHWKRRFVNQVNLDRFARVLKSGGCFRFASDIISYVEWTLEQCRQHEAFVPQSTTPHDWLRPYLFWPSTRYEAKALREGRTPHYLTFHRL